MLITVVFFDRRLRNKLGKCNARNESYESGEEKCFEIEGGTCCFTEVQFESAQKVATREYLGVTYFRYSSSGRDARTGPWQG